MAKKYHRIGKIMKKKDKTGEYIKLGDPTNKKFPFSVAIRITDAKGEKVYQGKDVAVFIQDPRDNPNLDDEKKAKIPDFIVADLVLVEDDS